MSKIVCIKACSFTFWIVCWVTSPLPLGRAEAKATDMVGVFYVSIIYRFQALIILLLSGCYCRARILRSARGGGRPQMVRSAPREHPRAPRPAPPGPAPAAPSRAPAAAERRQRRRFGERNGSGVAAASPPPAHGAVPAARLPPPRPRRPLRQLRTPAAYAQCASAGSGAGFATQSA